ncbi:hypothetical protein COY05_02645 [Candidatus Peregrinibacteria bacterium CG_4_10_14_0_2_um_filter_38_24]|nr:MAG: hypothetical protein COY05_02645 [Candidatus Peregrinibacteria bacterium CG_4_10_14_0_2_um_filter_38_24]
MNDSVFLIFGSITILFLLFIIFRAFLKIRVCALCASVGLTWVALLTLYRLNLFNNPLLIALLIGNSVVGLYYLVEKKISEKFHVFRLPFFLTLLLVGYSLIGIFDFAEIASSIVLVLGLWGVFGLMYFYRNNSRFKSSVSHIIDCCKNW